MKNKFAKWLLYATIWTAILITATVLSSCSKDQPSKELNTYVLEVSGNTESLQVTYSDAVGTIHTEIISASSFVKVFSTTDATKQITFKCYSMWPDDSIHGRIFKNGTLVWSVDREGGWSNFEVINTY